MSEIKVNDINSTPEGSTGVSLSNMITVNGNIVGAFPKPKEESTFVVMTTLGVITAGIFSRGETNGKDILKKILFFPPFIAFVIACLMNVFQMDFDDKFQSVFQKLGATITPVALVAVGFS